MAVPKPLPRSLRRLEDRIIELCELAAVSSGDQFRWVMRELQTAISEYDLRLLNKNSATILAWPEYPRERRKPSQSSISARLPAGSSSLP